VFYEPCIPGNTGNAIRLAAVVGATLHLIEPLAFDMDDAKLKRAGLDYHDLAHVKVHPSFDAFLASIPEQSNLYAFTTLTEHSFGDVKYQQDDFLLFGPEPTGLPPAVLEHPRVTKSLRIPMREGVRSLNLAVSASVAVYEAWRQLGFTGAS
jgi:tRNA (cytidine/uridine-2'-O-)-methyltransferase